MSELKIMTHLGPHLNIVNLLGACTKSGERDAHIHGCTCTLHDFLFFFYVSMKHEDASGPGNYDWIEPPPRSLSNRISRTKTPTLTLQNNIPALTKHSHISFVAHVGCGGRATVGEGGVCLVLECVVF